MSIFKNSTVLGATFLTLVGGIDYNLQACDSDSDAPTARYYPSCMLEAARLETARFEAARLEAARAKENLTPKNHVDIKDVNFNSDKFVPGEERSIKDIASLCSP